MDKQAHILIVDDTKTNLNILSACLEERYQIQTAQNGEQCLKFAKQIPQPDLILLDIEMPGMNGYEVCRQLKSETSTANVPIIFVTSKLDIKDEAKGLSLGAVDYITKPIHPLIVNARVKTHITLKKQKDKLERMALYDQLTGLYNRYYLLNTAKKKISAAIRDNTAISVMMIDIDLFKSVNDQYGHSAGDSIIKAVAKVLNRSCLNDDTAARFGGEEFVVVLSHCNLEEAMIKAENLREKIESLSPLGIKITISIGVSNLINQEDSFSDLLDRADQALYQAKQQGRNRTIGNV